MSGFLRQFVPTECIKQLRRERIPKKNVNTLTEMPDSAFDLFEIEKKETSERRK